MKKSIAWAAGLLVACTQQPDEQPRNEVAAPIAPPAPQPPAAPSAPAAPAVAPPSETPTPLAEPNRPIDPKSVEAAGQVVQHYGALIEQHRWTEANRLWGSATSAAQFARELEPAREVHLEIGELGSPEGAAGSIYVTMPVRFYGKDQKGTAFRRAAEVVLRRVNDVPGSTEAQRRWHIERIEWMSG